METTDNATRERAGMGAISIRVPANLRAALERFVSAERARGMVSDASECARRALVAGLGMLGYPVEAEDDALNGRR